MQGVKHIPGVSTYKFLTQSCDEFPKNDKIKFENFLNYFGSSFIR